MLSSWHRMAISKGRHGALDGAKIHVFDSGKKGCAFRQELEPRSAFSSSSRLGQEWRFRRDAIERWMAEKKLFPHCRSVRSRTRPEMGRRSARTNVRRLRLFGLQLFQVPDWLLQAPFIDCFYTK